MPLYSPATIGGTDGWTQDVTNTWTRASNTSFTVSGKDVTGQFQRGTYIKVTDSTTKYFVVTSSTFSTDTTVNITGGTDYSLSANPTAQYYSYEASPVGFPRMFNFSPTFTGFSSNPSGFSCWFSIIGQTCFFNYASGSAGTSNSTTFNMTLPVAPALGNYFIVSCINASVRQSAAGMCQTSGGSTTLFLYKDAATTGFTNSGTKDAWVSIAYQLN